VVFEEQPIVLGDKAVAASKIRYRVAESPEKLCVWARAADPVDELGAQVVHAIGEDDARAEGFHFANDAPFRECEFSAHHHSRKRRGDPVDLRSEVRSE
jgi:hypothetical protein